MSRELIVRSAAERDVAQALRWYERQRPGLGGEFLDEFQDCLNRISANPELFPPHRSHVRKAFMDRFPYTIYFEVESAAVKVCAVFHGSRNPKRLGGRF
ncbi:MAG: type II toxin-antitoxin system RelE/ParE family toxin [Chloroflexi bacterium]|nr:type II toxin-antitoxin system RelE/ParE family toxin [Chloroflexota bacterium]